MSRSGSGAGGRQRARPYGRDARRRGFSAPEALVALLLGLFVVHLGLSTLARLRTAELRLRSRADGLVSMRLARLVLRRELRHGVPGRDWHVGGDSLPLRAFRGTGLICSRDDTTNRVMVVYTGDRRPDPSKDSVLLLDANGRSSVRAVVGVHASGVVAEGCEDRPAAAESWTLDTPAGPGAVVARLFERGSYHLTGAALRYRRGTSGRQPLTPEVWAEGTEWVGPEERLALAAVPRDSSAGGPWEAFLAWRSTP